MRARRRARLDAEARARGRRALRQRVPQRRRRAAGHDPRAGRAALRRRRRRRGGAAREIADEPSRSCASSASAPARAASTSTRFPAPAAGSARSRSPPGLQTPVLSPPRATTPSRATGLGEIERGVLRLAERVRRRRARSSSPTRSPRSNGVAGTMRRLAAAPRTGPTPALWSSRRTSRARRDDRAPARLVAAAADATSRSTCASRSRPTCSSASRTRAARRRSTSRRPARSASAGSSSRGCSASRSSARTTPSSARTRCT